MSENDDAYRADEQTATAVEDKSFIESAGHVLNGLRLQAYGPERMWAADAIGLRYGRLTPEQTEQFNEDGTYPGMAADVPIVIWLCSLEKREDVLSARRNPNMSMGKIVQFAETHNMVTPKQKGWWDAYTIFLAIMREIHQSYGELGEKKTEAATVATEQATT